MARNKVFFHAGAPCQGCDGIGEMWRRLDAAGVPFGVYSVEGGGLIAEAAQYRNATLIYRSLATDVAPYDLSPRAAAEVQWALLMMRLPPEVKALQERVWIEVGNEQDKTRADWLGNYYAELAALAMGGGYRLCGPGWSTGEPEPEHWRSAGWLRYLRLCAANPERLGVTLHEYSLDADDIMAGSPWLAGRFRFLFDACRENGIANPTTFITECGWTHNDLPHADKAKADIAALAALYAGHEAIQAAFLWTVMGGGDKKTLAAELNALMPWLTEWTIATRFPDPTPVDDGDIVPPTPPPAAVNLLVNPSFEDGWTDSERYSTTQDPKGWTVEWNTGAGFDNPHSEWEYQVGECVHKSKPMLPAAERDVFVWDGNWTLKLFAGQRSFWARLKQTVELPKGRYRLTTPVWVDCYRWSGFKDYGVEPWQAEVMIKAGGREIRPWSLLVSGGRRSPVTEFEHGGGALALAVHFRCNWPISNNLWLDGWLLAGVKVSEPEPPPVEPPPVEPPPVDDRPVKLLDISKWQGTIDPAAMRAAGVDGVMLRASYATASGSWMDERAVEFAEQLDEAGIPYGWYHYYHPLRPAEEQFDAFQTIVDTFGYRMRPALDLEETAGLDGTTAGKAGRFAELMAATYPLADGKRHLIYTSLGYWRDKLKSPAWGANYDLWIAAWTTAAKPSVPKPWRTWALWQYTSGGNGPAHGIGSARVDLDRFNGDRAAWAAWLVGVDPAPPTAAELWEVGQASRAVARHPLFALEQAMIAAGYYPVGNETRTTAGGVPYAVHLGANAAGKERLYIARVPAWGDVWYQEGPGEPNKPVVDLLPYLRGDGRLYEVLHPDGRTETFQTQRDGDWFYQVKNGQWEQLYADSSYIWRGVDTSPGKGRFYIQFEPLFKQARWCPRYMAVGESWQGPGHTVQFYIKATCARSGENSGNATNAIRLVGRHGAKTWNGVTVEDVIELTNGTETYYYAKLIGLVGWKSEWGESYICEIHPPGARTDLIREKINCSY